MIFSMGSSFIFGSWIYEAGNNGKLQSRLLEDSDHHEDHSFLMGLKNVALVYQEYNSEYTQSLFKKLGPFSFGLHNMATRIPRFGA